MTQIEIRTEDGICPARIYGDHSAPSVLVYLDGIGMRPAMRAIAERIAAAGYHVLLPDVFYRMGPYTAPEPKALFSDPEVRAAWFAKAMGAVNVENTMPPKNSATRKNGCGSLRRPMRRRTSS